MTLGSIPRFSLETSIDTEAVIQNKPLAVRLSISGEGNLKQLKAFNFKESEEFKIYQSSVNDQITYTDKVKGIRHFEYIVVPKVSGNIILPIFSISSFSPEKKEFEVFSSKEVMVDVIQLIRQNMCHNPILLK